MTTTVTRSGPTHETNTADEAKTTLKHIGYNAMAFRQSFMYVSDLLCQADTVGISETWLRVGELSIIKPALLQSPALGEVVDMC